MLDALRTLPDTSGEQPLIRLAERNACRERRLLLEHARRNASRLVADARAEAERIRLHALRDGYTQGLLQAAGELAQALLLERGMAARLRSEVGQQVKDLLTQVLGSVEWIDSLLQCWVEDIGADRQAWLQVVAPKGCATALGERVRAHWPGPVTVDCDETARFVFRHAHQVLEFDLPAVVEPLGARLALQLAALGPAMQGIDAASADYLQTWVDGVVANVAVPAEEGAHAY